MTTGPTPPRDAEEQLRQQSRFTATLLETLETAIVACDEQGNLTLFNRASRELHGLAEVTLPPEEWSRYYNLYEADGRTPLATEDIPLFRALNGEHVEAIEMVIAPVEGVRHTLLAHGRPIFDLDGMLLGAVVAMHDITDRRQLEGDLRCISEIARLVALNADAREAVVQAGRELTGAAFSILFEPDGHGMLRPTVIAGLDPAVAAPVPLTAERSGTALSFRTGQSLFVADAADHPSVLPEVLRRPGVASVLFQPTHLGDEIVGVLVVGWNTPIANLQGREAGLA